MRRAVFLDRDGVLNRAFVGNDGKPHPPAGLDELEILEGVREACALLRSAGFLLIIVTNQPDVARGTQRREVVEAIHAALNRQVPVDDIQVCYHDDAAQCGCRKPQPGLLLEAGRIWHIDLARSFMVGDRWSDIEAGRQAGCLTVLIERAYSRIEQCTPDYRTNSLPGAVDWILGQEHAAARKGGQVIKSLSELRIKIYADGADKNGMLEMYANPLIKGFTTNPTLMRTAGVGDYCAFAHEVVAAIPDRPISFEVMAESFDQMEREAFEIASWGENVFVKIPVMDLDQRPAYDLMHRLSRAGVKINATALMTLEQVHVVSQALAEAPSAYVSVFAGRMADTGRDPVPLMAAAVEMLRPYPNQELLWASPRELLNIFQADAVGCHIITATNDLLRKLPLVGKDLFQFSFETVQMFFNDARKAGYTLLSSTT